MRQRENGEAVEMHPSQRSQDLQELKSYLLGDAGTVAPRAIECIQGTRAKILDDIGTKTASRSDKQILWIRGAPGSGKSSLSLSATSRLRRERRLISYFWFDRNRAATTTLTLWRHVAYDIARRFPPVQTQLLQKIRSGRVDLDSPLAVFTSLVEGSLSNLRTAVDRLFVIVIDGLDECDGLAGHLSPDRQKLLQTLARWPQLPKHFLLLVTSRAESDITGVLSPISIVIDIPSGRFIAEHPRAEASIEASEDIRVFLTYRFQQIATSLASLSRNWPGTQVIAKMVIRAGGNFMWATTATNFIQSGHPDDRLKIIMGHAPESMGMKPLYSLYSIILESSFESFTNSSEVEVLRAVLGTIVFAQRPFLDEDFTKLPTNKPVDTTMVELIRKRLRSVLDQGTALRFAHKSFEDFLLSAECPPKYRLRTDESHFLLTKLCLSTMTAELHFNMCSLKTSYLKNVDIPDIETKVANGIPSLLSYSCCFWADHLSHTPFDDLSMGEVKEVTLDKLLYWFEAMSLLKEINRVSPSLLLLLKWSHPSPDDEFKDFVHDARQFVGTFGHPIAQSAPHIYISALPFAPEHSLVARHFLPQFLSTLSLSTGRSATWPACVFTSEHHKGAVNSVAFSPDEKYFISGSDDFTILVHDSETGEPISAPFSVDAKVKQVFFDPDGRRIWASSLWSKVACWDIETGDKRLDFQAQNIIGCCSFDGGQNIITVSSPPGTVTFRNAATGERLSHLPHLPIGSWVETVSFSPDGCSMACAGRNDTRVRIWGLAERGEKGGPPYSLPQSKHTKRITALSFSVDGDFAVSGSEDGTILVWDVKTGSTVGNLLATGHVEVNAVAYDPKTGLLVMASGNPGKVVVWNASTHETVLGPLEGHTSRVTAIALSRDGRRVLTASEDKTVRMWDLGRKRESSATGAMGGHRSEIKYFAFSPCGKKLASLGSDHMIGVWDANTGKPLLTPIDTPSLYTCIIFSPSGHQILAYSSEDGTVQVLDVDTGELAFQHEVISSEELDTQWIQHLAFRSTDQRLITCSNNGVVRIWRLEHDSLTAEFSSSCPQSLGTQGRCEIVALAPTGLTAIVRDKTRSLPHYIWSTTTHQPLSVTFSHNQHISGHRVAHSPSGRFFAATISSAAGRESTLRVWNNRTGELIRGSPHALNGRIDELAFSPDGSYIALTLDRTEIWVLDAGAHTNRRGPFSGHTTLITALTFSPDGKKMVSGSKDGQIRIWNTEHLSGVPRRSAGFLGIGTHMRDGWVMGVDGQLLFWVPRDHRESLFWPGNAAVVGGSGITTDLELSKFRHGTSWAECVGEGK